MEIILKILRNIEGKEFYQSFRYETKTDSDTVATALTDLNTEVSLKDIDGNTLNHINSIAKKLYQESKDKLNCEGLTIVQNNDYGQEIKHYHMHLIPRYKNDAWHTSMNKNNLKEPKEIYEIITKK